MDNSPIAPDQLGPPVHPSRMLRDELEELGWSHDELASRVNGPPKMIARVLQGRAPVSGELASDLGDVLGISSGLLCRLQQRYDHTIARLEADSDIRSDLALLPQIPWTNLKNNGWVEDVGTDVERICEARLCYGVSRLVDLPSSRIRAAFRITPGSRVDPWSLAAWVQQGEWQSIERNFLRPDDVRSSFSPELLKATLPHLRRLTMERPFWPRLRALTGQAGLQLEFVPHISKSGTNGVTRWLEDGRPLIQLSILRKRADIFWFTCMHEIGHVLHGDRSQVYIDLAHGPGATDEAEATADAFARDILVPAKEWNAFASAGAFSATSVKAFAADQQVHPGIVVGRLQHEKNIKPDRLNDLRVSYDESDFVD